MKSLLSLMAAGWRWNTGATSPGCSVWRMSLSSFGLLSFFSLTARRCCQKPYSDYFVNGGVQEDEKTESLVKSRNYERLSGVGSSCRGAPADGKLRLRPGGAATFIDFKVARSKNPSSEGGSGLWDPASGEPWCQTSLFRFRLCVAQGIQKRRGGNLNPLKNRSLLLNWQWSINERDVYLD